MKQHRSSNRGGNSSHQCHDAENRREMAEAHRAGKRGHVRVALGGERACRTADDRPPCVWRLAAEAGACQHADGMDIGRRRDPSAQKLLRGGVAGRADAHGVAIDDGQGIARMELRGLDVL